MLAQTWQGVKRYVRYRFPSYLFVNQLFATAQIAESNL